MPRIMLLFILAALAWGTLLFLAVKTAYPHDAPSGWAYDTSCCNTIDCRPVDGPDANPRHHKVQVIEVRGGYRIIKPGVSGPGELVEWSSGKIRESKDGDYHWCSQGGWDVTSTICLYVPNRGY